jgi:hypothetical protein
LNVASTAPTGGDSVSAYERFCHDPVGNPDEVLHRLHGDVPDGECGCDVDV